MDRSGLWNTYSLSKWVVGFCCCSLLGPLSTKVKAVKVEMVEMVEMAVKAATWGKMTP